MAYPSGSLRTIMSLGQPGDVLLGRANVHQLDAQRFETVSCVRNIRDAKTNMVESLRETRYVLSAGVPPGNWRRFLCPCVSASRTTYFCWTSSIRELACPNRSDFLFAGNWSQTL